MMSVDKARINAILHRRKMTQADLADMIGVHKSTLSVWLSGARDMPSSALFRIADVLGISLGVVVDKGTYRYG